MIAEINRIRSDDVGGVAQHDGDNGGADGDEVSALRSALVW